MPTSAPGYGPSPSEKLDKNGLLKTGEDGDPVAAVKQDTGVLDQYTPQFITYESYFWGTATTYDTLTAGSANNATPVDITNLHPDRRSLEIINEAGTGVDYDYVILFSNTGLIADAITVASNATNTTSIRVNIPASLGYAKYCHVQITPDAADAGTELNFRVRINGGG